MSAIDVKMTDADEPSLPINPACIATATTYLRAGLKNPKAVLTPLQQQVISALCHSKRDVLYIDRTGAGKSETYFIAAQMLRDKQKHPGAGPIIVVTPLITLIHDQMRRANQFGNLKAIGIWNKKQMGDMQHSAVSTHTRTQA